MEERIKVISLLKNLSKEEFGKFEAYLATPLFNKRQILFKLLRKIKKYYPDFSEGFSKENLFKDLYRGSKYNDELMRNLFARLKRSLEGFLSYLHYEKDEFYQRYGTLAEISGRNFHEIFKKKFEDLRKWNEENLPITLGTYSRSNQMALLRSSHYFDFKHSHDTDSDILKNREAKLTEFFLADILSIYAKMSNQLSMYPERDYSFGLLVPLLQYLEHNDQLLSGNVYIQMYFNNLMLSRKQEDKYYDNLKKILNENMEKLSVSEKSEMYTTLQNYLQEQVFKGRKTERDKFELFKESFANDAQYSGRSIGNTSLIIAVSNSLMLREFSAAVDFVNDYIDKVDEYYKESTRFYCYALIDYYKADYGSSLKNLAKVKLEDVSFKILIRTLSMMVYFSMDDAEGLYSLEDSFRHFLNENKKTSAYYFNLYSNFINFTIKLFKVKKDPNRYNLKNFKKELQNSENVAKKKWLIEQANEIEKSLF